MLAGPKPSRSPLLWLIAGATVLLVGMLVFSVEIHLYAEDLEDNALEIDFQRQAADTELVLQGNFQQLTISALCARASAVCDSILRPSCMCLSYAMFFRLGTRVVSVLRR